MTGVRLKLSLRRTFHWYQWPPWGKTPSPQTDKSNLLHPLRFPFESLALLHSNRCCHKSNQQPHQCKLSDPQPTCFQVNPNLTPWPADQTLTENTWTTPDKSKQCIAKDLKTWLVEIQGTLKMIWKGDLNNQSIFYIDNMKHLQIFGGLLPRFPPKIWLTPDIFKMGPPLTHFHCIWALSWQPA